MRLQINDSQIFEINETKENVIKSFINEDCFLEDMSRRVSWILQHKYDQCFKRFYDYWSQKLISEGTITLPTDPDAFAQLIFLREDYKSRKELDLEESLI